jgi:RimJ/RimL family protein N-acetyltransferase
MTGTIPKLESLSTPRLLLRRWRPGDIEVFAAMNADPEVMRHFPSLLTPLETEAVARRIDDFHENNGYGLWAAELLSSRQFIGFIGMIAPRFQAHFTPCVEIGWRLRKEHWGNGYAPEGAREVLRDGFERVGLAQIVSMTTTTNKPSMRVMEKIGMTRNPADDFDHPLITPGHAFCRHVLYRLTAEQWRKERGTVAGAS